MGKGPAKAREKQAPQPVPQPVGVGAACATDNSSAQAELQRHQAGNRQVTAALTTVSEARRVAKGLGVTITAFDEGLLATTTARLEGAVRADRVLGYESDVAFACDPRVQSLLAEKAGISDALGAKDRKETDQAKIGGVYSPSADVVALPPGEGVPTIFHEGQHRAFALDQPGRSDLAQLLSGPLDEYRSYRVEHVVQQVVQVAAKAARHQGTLPQVVIDHVNRTLSEAEVHAEAERGWSVLIAIERIVTVVSANAKDPTTGARKALSDTELESIRAGIRRELANHRAPTVADLNAWL